MRLKVIIVQIVCKWDALVVYTFPALASVKHIVDELQCSLQLTILGASMSSMPRVPCVQSHVLADAVNVVSLVLHCVQVGAP